MTIKRQQRKPMARENTRDREDQKVFIKKYAKDKGLTEGEVFRKIIDFYIN